MGVPVEIKIPLKRFIKFVEDTKTLDKEYPWLNQREWFLTTWQFDNFSAVYVMHAIHMPLSAGPERGK